jgi:hypothetical protein
MPCTIPKIASLTAAMILLLSSAASADDMGGEAIDVPPPVQSEATYTDAYTDSTGSGWQYDDYYIFPLTRHMQESGLPRVAQYLMYPLAVGFDLGQLPFGAVAGLGGK